MPRRGALPRSNEDLTAPPPSLPVDWSEGALSVSTFCELYDVSRSEAFDLMGRGRLLWGRVGRQRRVSRRSARRLFATETDDVQP